MFQVRIELYRIKQNLDNNLSASILYKVINNKPCFYPSFKETVLTAHIRINTRGLSCNDTSAMAQEISYVTITLKHSFTY